MVLLGAALFQGCVAPRPDSLPLFIYSTQPAEIWVDGAATGLRVTPRKTGQVELKTSKSEHTIELRSPAYGVHQEKVRLSNYSFSGWFTGSHNLYGVFFFIFGPLSFFYPEEFGRRYIWRPQSVIADFKPVGSPDAQPQQGTEKAGD